MSAPLTKKQQKALAFRSKQKAKKADLPEPDAVPEEDIDDADEVVDAVVVSHSSATAEASSSGDKKRKRDGGEAEAAPKKGKVKKTAWDDDEEGEEEEGEEGKKKSKKEVKQRFILFVGEWIVLLACLSTAVNRHSKSANQ
jgi:nucleolar protein 6